MVEVAHVSDEADPNRRGGPAAATQAAPPDVPDPETGYEVIDPDVDLHDPRQRRPPQWDLILATAAGGILGAEARYGVGLAVPHSGAQFPWATVLINATGCAVLGVVMALLPQLTSPHRLVRPFVGIGVLGGYTTYSSFAVDAERLVLAHRALIAFGYVAATLVSCGLAVFLAATTTKGIGEAIITARIRRVRAVGPPRR
jgi:fluoride exporter